MGSLSEISKIVDKHRAEVVVTCPEDCWCWDVEAAICGHSEHENEPAVQADGEYRCEANNITDPRRYPG